MTQTSGPIRISPSGERIVGENDGDVLTWDAATDEWRAEPGGGGGAVDSVFGRTGDVTAQSGDYSATLIDNTSDVPGANVSEALDNLDDDVTTVASALASLNSSAVANASAVAGATVTNALGTLSTSSGITNSSTVAGATVTAALDTLAAVLTGRRLLGVGGRLTAGAQTIACPAGTRGILVRMVAGGAGGGHGAFAAGPIEGAGGGGGSGAEQEFFYTSASNIASVDVVCGAAGNAGTVGVAGGSGGNTTVTINGELFTSTGGTGSNNSNSNTAAAGQTRPGGAPGLTNFQTGSNFTLLRVSGGSPGASGSFPVVGSGGTFAVGGAGGSSSMGGGGLGTADGVGGSATGNGAGGGGGGSSNGFSRNGGPGTPGGVMLFFFS